MSANVDYFAAAKMTEEGMLFNGFVCQPIIEKCVGCDRTAEFEGQTFCKTYPQPESKWALGACNFATHIRATVDKAGKVKINPLKASKRAARGR